MNDQSMIVGEAYEYVYNGGEKLRYTVISNDTDKYKVELPCGGTCNIGFGTKIHLSSKISKKKKEVTHDINSNLSSELCHL